MVPKIILCPTDLSERAEAAVDYACELARPLGATVHLVHVMGVPMMGVPELGMAMTSAAIDTLAVEQQAALDTLAKAKAAKCQIGQAILRTGDARDMINQTAKELGADLIVVGTHGRTGVARVLLGSVAELIVRTAPCPVLTVRNHFDAEPRSDAA